MKSRLSLRRAALMSLVLVLFVSTAPAGCGSSGGGDGDDVALADARADTSSMDVAGPEDAAPDAQAPDLGGLDDIVPDAGEPDLGGLDDIVPDVEAPDTAPADIGVDTGPQFVDRVFEMPAGGPAIDLLFIVDNSGTMGERQAALANSIDTLTTIFDDNLVSARYGVTTTDNGNPWCPAGTTTPESGRLVLSSCQTRLGDFLFGGTVDVQDAACNDLCALSSGDLTVSALAPDTSPRAWVQSGPEGQNLPETTSIAEALRCFLPQGINGCGFESQLESMYLALVRARTEGEDQYGFLRDQASLLVVFLTDEADCSADPDHHEIFEQDGARTFWSDPTAPFPTSAICWNAGVACTGDPSMYDGCDPVDLDESGNAATTEDDAVLYPLSRYRVLLDTIQEEKTQHAPEAWVRVALIAGVAANGSVAYMDVSNTDPAFQDSFGIGPGCTPASGEPAVPPVRLLELAEEFSAGTPASVCASDYTAILERLADQVVAVPQRECFDGEVADLVPETALLDADCDVVELLPDETESTVPPCPRTTGGAYRVDPSTGGYEMPDTETELCFALLVDADGATSGSSDDISAHCLGQGTNLELAIARKPGAPPQADARISITCRVSAPQP